MEPPDQTSDSAHAPSGVASDSRQAQRTLARALGAFAACVAVAAFLGCSSDGTDDDDASDGGGGGKSAAQSALSVGADARGQCYHSALVAHGLFAKAALAQIASENGLELSSPRVALDSWPPSVFGAAAREVASCRAIEAVAASSP
jgi:hypothetical protein